MSVKLTALMLATTLYGAAHAGDTGPDTAPERTIRVAVEPGTELAMPNPTSRPAVKNAPYVGDIVTERQQVLGDGNQISQRSTSRAYRDSAGRTREEAVDDKGEVTTVVIKDPDAGVRWVLSPQRKTAARFAMRTGNSTAVFYVPRDGKPHVLERRTNADGAEVLSFKMATPGSPGTADKGGMRIEPNREAQAVSILPQMNSLLSSAFTDMKWSRQATRRELPAREIDGIKATGQLRSYEIPAGEVGNRNAIFVSDETWYAPELKITLSTKHSDPRTGNSVFRIENLKREEPAAALFTVPADYTVTEVLPPMQGALKKKPE